MANTPFKHIGIVCYRLAGRNRIFDFHFFASALGEIDCSKRNVEVKGHLSEVSGLAVRDSRILLAVSKAKLQLEPCPVIFRDIKGRLCVVCREVQLPLVSTVFLRVPDGKANHASHGFGPGFQPI